MKIHQVCHKWQGKSTWLLKLDEPQNLLTITYINHRNISIIWHRRCFQRVIFLCQEQESLYISFGNTPYFDHYHIKAFQWGEKKGYAFLSKTQIFATEAEDLPAHTKAAGTRQSHMPTMLDCCLHVSNEEWQQTHTNTLHSDTSIQEAVPHYKC